jgi:hypothetical protein
MKKKNFRRRNEESSSPEPEEKDGLAHEVLRKKKRMGVSATDLSKGDVKKPLKVPSKPKDYSGALIKPQEIRQRAANESILLGLGDSSADLIQKQIVKNAKDSKQYLTESVIKIPLQDPDQHNIAVGEVDYTRFKKRIWTA